MREYLATLRQLDCAQYFGVALVLDNRLYTRAGAHQECVMNMKPHVTVNGHTRTRVSLRACSAGRAGKKSGMCSDACFGASEEEEEEDDEDEDELVLEAAC